jgi:putative two-component system response regulator
MEYQMPSNGQVHGFYRYHAGQANGLQPVRMVQNTHGEGCWSGEWVERIILLVTLGCGSKLNFSFVPTEFLRLYHIFAKSKQLLSNQKVRRGGDSMVYSQFLGRHSQQHCDVLVVCTERWRAILVEPLRLERHSVIVADDFQSAMSLLHEAEFKVLVFDLSLCDGLDLNIAELRSAGGPSLQIVLLAGDSQTAAAIEGITQGADGHLPLPVDERSLKLQVRFSLGRFEELRSDLEDSTDLESVLLQQTVELQQMHVEVMKLLSVASCYRDHETGTHNQRVGMVSGLLARAIGWTDQQVEDIRLAALMHDIGKLAIPDAILRKPGGLTPEEYRLMQMHTIFGDEILAASKLPVLELSRQIALCHHERWDGNGYPHKLKEWQIPEAARIVAIADVYDALTHDRIYRPAMSEDQALQLMREGRGSQFDPEIIDIFFNIREGVSQVNTTIVESPDENKQAIWKEIAYNF